MGESTSNTHTINSRYIACEFTYCCIWCSCALHATVCNERTRPTPVGLSAVKCRKDSSHTPCDHSVSSLLNTPGDLDSNVDWV